jgi:CheY-like chemotaxis protein
MPGPSLILVADDDQNDVFFLQRAFRRVGLEHELIHVADGQEAVDYLAGSPNGLQGSRRVPDLLLLDLKMPKMTGFEVLSWLQTQPKLEDLRVIVLSGSNQPRDIEQAKNLGADDYCVKPVEFDDLMKFVQDLDKRWLNVPGNAQP